MKIVFLEKNSFSDFMFKIYMEILSLLENTFNAGIWIADLLIRPMDVVNNQNYSNTETEFTL
jgi:hypothetical protein